MAPASRGAGRTPAGAPHNTLRLWAPWRDAYLRRAGSQRRPACIFCHGRLTAAERRRNLVLYDDGRALVMLNRYPYNNGHIMIAPRRHVATPELLTRSETSAIAELLSESIKRLRHALRPAGFNLGANLGRVAGAGFAGHLHWHVVPRWDGDTNFMPVLASTRVLSQHLKDSYAQLQGVFGRIGGSSS
ncbi:MAG: HIT family protein [Candidatus Binataceae bacterium]